MIFPDGGVHNSIWSTKTKLSICQQDAKASAKPNLTTLTSKARKKLATTIFFPWNPRFQKEPRTSLQRSHDRENHQLSNPRPEPRRKTWRRYFIYFVCCFHTIWFLDTRTLAFYFGHVCGRMAYKKHFYCICFPHKNLTPLLFTVRCTCHVKVRPSLWESCTSAKKWRNNLASKAVARPSFVLWFWLKHSTLTWAPSTRRHFGFLKHRQNNSRTWRQVMSAPWSLLPVVYTKTSTHPHARSWPRRLSYQPCACL